MPEKPTSRVFGLDVMRTLAIGLVVVSHALLFFPKAREGFFREVQGIGLLFGYLGVELFFVLSGFLIGGILLSDFTQKPSLAGLRHFWLRRWFRTLPNYFLFLGVNVTLALWLGRTIPSLGPYFVFLQNFTSPPPPFFVESWSLTVEEWFYLLIPAAVFVAVRFLPVSLRGAVLAVAVIALVGVTLAREWYVAAERRDWLLGVRVVAAFRLDACMFGVVGAWILRFYPEVWARLRQPGLLLGLGLWLAIVWNIFDRGGGFFDVKTTGFTLTSLGALCFLPMLEKWKESQGMLAGATTRISLWSYSLYLVNLPVHTVCHHFLAPKSIESAILAALIFVATSVAMAALVYRFFERPMLGLRERWAPKSVSHPDQSPEDRK